MTTLQRLEDMKDAIDFLIEKNQQLKTPQAREDSGFYTLYDLSLQIGWVIKDIEHLYS